MNDKTIDVTVRARLDRASWYGAYQAIVEVDREMTFGRKAGQSIAEWQAAPWYVRLWHWVVS